MNNYKKIENCLIDPGRFGRNKLMKILAGNPAKAYEGA